MRALLAMLFLNLLLAHGAFACDGPGALGVSRSLEVDARGGFTLGTLHYAGTLPLEDKEVVLTFDDGPVPKTTEAILKALDEACVKATFFVAGRAAEAQTALLAAIARQGHIVAAHSYAHSPDLARMVFEKAVQDIDQGFAVVSARLGRDPAPYFRFPSTGGTRRLAEYLGSKNIGVFSADIVGDEWSGTPDEVRARLLARIETKKRGIVLLHGNQPSTAAMLPALLKDLGQRGFRLVQIVPKRELPTALRGGIYAIATAPDTEAAGPGRADATGAKTSSP